MNKDTPQGSCVSKEYGRQYLLVFFERIWVFDCSNYVSAEVWLPQWALFPVKEHIPCICSLFEPRVVHFVLANVQNSSAWDRNYKKRPQARSFNGDPSPSVYTDAIYVIKWTRHNPFLHTASDQKLEAGRPGNEAGVSPELWLPQRGPMLMSPALKTQGQSICRMMEEYMRMCIREHLC